MIPVEPEPSPSSLPDSSAEADSPRLGILHLMVWIACVALYLGLKGLTRQRELGVTGMTSPLPGLLWIVLETLKGVGAGTALAGLLLWAVRRGRGWRFPRHPGEYLLVVLGLSAALNVCQSLLSRWLLDVDRRFLLIALGIAGLGVYGVIHLWPVFAVKNRRWRTLFVLRLIEPLVSMGTIWLLVQTMGTEPFSIITVQIASAVAMGAVLGVLLLMDHVDGKRYPWTHWLGVGIELWSRIVVVAVILSFLWEASRWDGYLSWEVEQWPAYVGAWSS